MEDRDFKPGDLVKHFKRETVENPYLEYIYEIIGQAHHTETGEELMVYGNLEKGTLCARPLKMFTSEVDHEKYPNIKQEYRFEKLDVNEALEIAMKTLSNVKEAEEEKNGYRRFV